MCIVSWWLCLGISSWVDFEMPPKMRAIAHARAKECICDYCNWEAVGWGDIDMKLLVNLRRFIEEYCIVGVYSIKGEVN